jgi:cytoskeletal protein RodZ
MAPLDTGNVINLKRVDPLEDRAGPSPADFEKLGGYLQAVRRHRDVSLDNLAETTRISRAYLRAIEDGEHSALPSRPFAIGYVRSYAQALGLDGEAAVARFKQEAPDLSGPLRNPIGVQHEDNRRNPLIFVAAGLVVAGLISWNVVQRATGAAAPSPAPFSTLSGAQAAEPQLPKGPIALGAATAPPADQTMPTPYVTPGLDAAVVPGAKPGQPNAPTPTVYAAPATFTPKGEVYGAAATAPHVVLQATKAASLIVRGAGGAVYFARQLQPGEAYRAPVGEGLSLDISDPAAFNLYMGGQLQGTMAANLVTIDKLVAKTPPAAPLATASVSPTARPAAVTSAPQPAKSAAPAA